MRDASSYSGKLRRANARINRSGPPLTVRQGEVLALVRQGFTNRVIALTLGIGEETVKTHVRLLLEKHGVGSRKYLM